MLGSFRLGVPIKTHVWGIALVIAALCIGSFWAMAVLSGPPGVWAQEGAEASFVFDFERAHG